MVEPAVAAEQRFMPPNCASEGGEAPQSSARTSNSSFGKRWRRSISSLEATASDDGDSLAPPQPKRRPATTSRRPPVSKWLALCEDGAEDADGGGEGNENDLRLPAPDAPPAQEGGEEGVSSLQLALLEVEKVKLHKLWDEGVRPIFDWVDTYRTQSKGGDGTSLEEFLDELSSYLKELGLTPEEIKKVLAEAPDDNAWANLSWSNAENGMARNSALGRLGCFILKALAGVCYGGCGRHLVDMPNSASDLDHEIRDAKTPNTDGPSEIARENGLAALLDEVLKGKCTPKCHEDHDRGPHRGYDVTDDKMVRLIAGKPRTHASRLTAEEVVLEEAIPFVQIAVLIAESYAGDWRNRGSDMAQLRASTLCITGIVLDGLVMWGGPQWNGDNIDHTRETDRILERVIVMNCGCCLNPNCPNENDGDLTQKSALAHYAYVHDHNGKKSEGISEMIAKHRGPLRYLSEMMSWTDVLCFICNARRTANQKRGCKERCFKDVGTDCDCDECDDDDVTPTLVTWS